MSRILVWDIPTRMIHWAFAASLTGALGVGLLADNDHPLFRVHMLLGVVALFLLAVRTVMGFAGSQYARFGAFPLRPREILVYLVSAVFSETKRYAGNNPGSALAAVLMFLLVPLLFASGIGLGGEEVAEIHGSLAWVLMAVIVLHLSGIVWHTIRHRENVSMSMVTGKKDGNPADAIQSTHPLWGAALLLAGGAWITALFADQDANTTSVKLPVIGISLQIGAHESEGHGHRGRDHRREGQEDDD